MVGQKTVIRILLTILKKKQQTNGKFYQKNENIFLNTKVSDILSLDPSAGLRHADRAADKSAKNFIWAEPIAAVDGQKLFMPIF